MKSEQTTFDTFLKHAQKSIGPSYDPTTNGCLYRGKEGRKCLVGMEIKDEDYTEALETMPANTNEVRELMVKYGHNPELCRDIQTVHDDLVAHEIHLDRWSTEQWQAELLKGMEEVAKEYKLKFKM